MSIRTRQLVGGVCLFLLAAAFGAELRAADQPTVTRYELVCEGTIKAPTPKGTGTAVMVVVLNYSWATDANRRSLTLESMTSKLTTEREVAIEHTLTREFVTDRKSGVEVKTRVSELPPAARAAIEGTFGTPAMDVDLDGKAARMHLPPESAAIDANGLLSPILFLQPVAPPDAAAWQLDRWLIAGDAGRISGTVRYKVTSEADGKRQIASEAELKPSSDAVAAKRVGAEPFQLKGEHTLDVASGTWVSGSFRLTRTGTVYADGKPAQTTVDFVYRVRQLKPATTPSR